MSKQNSHPSKKTQKRIFEDIHGNNTVFISNVWSYEGELVTEFAFVISDFKDEEVSVTMLSKSDIPRLIRELAKLI